MEGLIVSKVRQRSPADLVGLCEGDHVLVINGMDALDMSHEKAVQVIDQAVYTLEIIVGRYERTQKQETIYLDNQSLRSRQMPQEITTTELQLFWEKEMPLKPSRRVMPPPKPTVILANTRPAMSTPSSKPRPPLKIYIPPPPQAIPQPHGHVPVVQKDPSPVTYREPTPVTYREQTPEWEKRIVPKDPDVSSVSVKQLMKEFDVPEIAPELKKKTYADSSFYSDPSKFYPTIEEQMEMARKVAESLQAPENTFSRGVNIFEKQRLRADKHVREGPDPQQDPIADETKTVKSATEEELEHMVPPSPPPPPPPPPPSFPGLQPIDKPTRPIPPPPPLLPGQPKTVQEFLEKIKVFPTNRHSEVDPQKCFDIASALYTSDSRGAEMFARRHRRAKKWAAEGDDQTGMAPEPTLAAGPGPTESDPMKLKLLSKLPQQKPLDSSAARKVAAPGPTQQFKVESAAATPTRASLVNDQTSHVPTPSPITVGEGTPKPFKSMDGSDSMDYSETGHQRPDGSQPGWRPVKFNVAQAAT